MKRTSASSVRRWSTYPEMTLGRSGSVCRPALLALGSALTGMDPGRSGQVRSGQEGREDVSAQLQVGVAPSMEVSGFTHRKLKKKNLLMMDGR